MSFFKRISQATFPEVSVNAIPEQLAMVVTASVQRFRTERTEIRDMYGQFSDDLSEYLGTFDWEVGLIVAHCAGQLLALQAHPELAKNANDLASRAMDECFRTGLAETRHRKNVEMAVTEIVDAVDALGDGAMAPTLKICGVDPFVSFFMFDQATGYMGVYADALAKVRITQ